MALNENFVILKHLAASASRDFNLFTIHFSTPTLHLFSFCLSTCSTPLFIQMPPPLTEMGKGCGPKVNGWERDICIHLCMFSPKCQKAHRENSQHSRWRVRLLTLRQKLCCNLLNSSLVTLSVNIKQPNKLLETQSGLEHCWNATFSQQQAAVIQELSNTLVRHSHC